CGVREALRRLRESGLVPRRPGRVVLFTGGESRLAGAAAYARRPAADRHVAAFETDAGMAAPDAIGVGNEETVHAWAALLPAFQTFTIRRFRPHPSAAHLKPIAH